MSKFLQLLNVPFSVLAPGPRAFPVDDTDEPSLHLPHFVVVEDELVLVFSRAGHPLTSSLCWRGVGKVSEISALRAKLTVCDYDHVVEAVRAYTPMYPLHAGRSHLSLPSCLSAHVFRRAATSWSSSRGAPQFSSRCSTIEYATSAASSSLAASRSYAQPP